MYNQTDSLSPKNCANLRSYYVQCSDSSYFPIQVLRVVTPYDIVSGCFGMLHSDVLTHSHRNDMEIYGIMPVRLWRIMVSLRNNLTPVEQVTQVTLVTPNRNKLRHVDTHSQVPQHRTQTELFAHRLSSWVPDISMVPWMTNRLDDSI